MSDDRIYYSRSQIIKIASNNSLGNIHFQFNLAQNTGRYFEVGYIFSKEDGKKLLFCKTTSFAEGFYLCNEFSKLS